MYCNVRRTVQRIARPLQAPTRMQSPFEIETAIAMPYVPGMTCHFLQVSYSSAPRNSRRGDVNLRLHKRIPGVTH